MKQRQTKFLNIREIKRHDKQNKQIKHSSTQCSRVRGKKKWGRNYIYNNQEFSRTDQR